jgi:arylsulfatase A-like enzyme
LRPPSGTPNVLIVLIDDVGFGASSAFGGPVNMPNTERLAKDGLKYTRFHTTALCSPTRAALLSGRNHHSVGMGGITEMATSHPGFSSIRPNTMAPLAEILRLNGYATAQFGKCHEVPAWEASPAGPFDRWPTGSGFEHFFGFIAGETNQWYPALHEDVTAVEPWGTPEEGYHFMADMTDRAIAWVRQQKALTPHKPFFVYFAPGATHAPHHVPKEWADKYKGQFDDGWDTTREETFKRQKKLGVIPKDAELTARHDQIPAWDDMDEKLKPVLARQMEVYAGFLEYTDHHIGLLLDALEALEALDDTLVYLIIGDNGASAEGALQGTLNEIAIAEAPGIETPEYLAENIDKFGTPEAYNHYAVGWAHAMCTPYQWTKQIASHWGGTRNATIVRWRHQGQGPGPGAVPPRDRRGADNPGGGRAPGADGRERHHPGADARRQHGLLVRRRGRSRAARDAVLRDVLQPGHLPQGLVGSDEAPHPVAGARGGNSPRRGRVGALRRLDRLDARARPREGAAGEAGGAAAALPDRGGQVQRAAVGRPHGRANQPGARRPSSAHRTRLAGALRRDERAQRELHAQHEEQVAYDHGRARCAEGRG